MRVYVINLAAATDRLAHISRQLGAAGIDFERFEAIDALQARLHRCAGLIPPMRLRSWTAAEIGCLLSHHELWARIAAGSDAFAAVLEDDLFIDRRLKLVLDGDVTLPRDADLIKLETVRQTIVLRRLAVRREAGIRFHRLRALHYGTGAYLVSRGAAQRLVTLLGAFDMPVDDALFSPDHAVGRTLKTWQVVPALAAQSAVLPGAAARPELATRMEREREAARDINHVMGEQAGLAGDGDAAGERGAALLRRLDRLRARIAETRMVVPFEAGEHLPRQGAPRSEEPSIA